MALAHHPLLARTNPPPPTQVRPFWLRWLRSDSLELADLSKTGVSSCASRFQCSWKLKAFVGRLHSDSLELADLSKTGVSLWARGLGDFRAVFEK